VIAPESGAPGTITYTFNTKGVVPILTNTESTTQISGVSGVALYQDNNYLAVNGGKYIYVIKISESGALSIESYYQEQDSSNYIAYGSNSEFVFTNDSYYLYSYSIDNFSESGSIEVSTQDFLYGIAINESGTFAYATDGESTVYTLSIGNTGAFHPESSVSVANSNPSGIALSPDGAYAYVLNNNNNKIYVYSIGSNGYLTPVKDSVYLPGLGQNAVAITSYKAP